MERKAGETIGGYTIVRKLGAGAFADVYLARDPRHGNRQVALKVIREDSGEAMEERGASLLRKVNHPNIVKVYYVGHVEGRLTVVMEYVPGKTLREMLHSHKALPESRALAITLQIADALTFLHELRIDEKVGVAHLDLKPSNILVEPDDHTRITDFSTSRLGVCGATTSGCGSPAYMAPEQFLGHPVLASDIWAMGVLLYEMLAGQPFFRAASVEDYKKLILGSPGQWAAMTSSLPAGIRSIILRCVAHSPQDRFPSARELADRLRDLLDGCESLACENCGATLPENGVCPLCGREAPDEGSRRDPAFWPSPTLTGGGPSGRTDLPLAGSRTGIPDWANRSIDTVADLPPFRAQAAGTPAAAPSRPAQVVLRRKKGSRVAAFSFFMVLVGVGAALWFLLGPSFHAGGGAATAHSSRQTTVTSGAEPASDRPDRSAEGAEAPARAGASGGNPGVPAGTGDAVPPESAPPASVKRAPDIKPWSSPSVAERGKPASRPESAREPSAGSRVVPGTVVGAPAGSGPAPTLAEVLSDSALPETWWPEEDYATRLERIRSLERTPAGSYDDRIRLLDGFIAECGDPSSRAQAQALLRVWKWEKNEFARAEAVDRAKDTRICEAMEAWRDFSKSARTVFRKGYAEGRLQFWSDKLRSYDGQADVRVVAAARLPRRDMRGGVPSPPDAYFVIKQNERQVYRSRTLTASEFPVWNEAARVHFSPGSRLTLEIWDEDPLDDDLLLRFQINPVPEDGPYTARAAGASVDIVIEREQ